MNSIHAARLERDVGGVASSLIHADLPTSPGLAYLAAHPEIDRDEPVGCCMGGAVYGLLRCTCWEPVYEHDQAPPRPLAGVRDVDHPARSARCGDCAYRRGSQERSDEFDEENLLALAEQGKPFWCHDGMRRPMSWRHPDLGEVPGHPDEWQPEALHGIPYRADGQPALLCAGWAQQRRHATPPVSPSVPAREETR